VINQRDKASRGKTEHTEGLDEASEEAREHRPDKVGKSSAALAKGVLIGLQTRENLRQVCLAGGSF
jgi:hypothetical protein